MPAGAPADLCPGGRQPPRGLGSPCTASRGATAVARVCFPFSHSSSAFTWGQSRGLPCSGRRLLGAPECARSRVRRPGAGVSPRCARALPCEPSSTPAQPGSSPASAFGLPRTDPELQQLLLAASPHPAGDLVSGLPGSGSRASLLCPWQFVGTFPTSRWLVASPGCREERAQESSRALVVPAAVPGQARGQTPKGQQGYAAATALALQTPMGSLVLGRGGSVVRSSGQGCHLAGTQSLCAEWWGSRAARRRSA